MTLDLGAHENTLIRKVSNLSTSPLEPPTGNSLEDRDWEEFFSLSLYVFIDLSHIGASSNH